jgi:hypothetical protein
MSIFPTLVGKLHEGKDYDLFTSFFFFWWDWGFNSALCTWKVGTLPLEPHLQSLLLWLFGDGGLTNYLPGLALNCDLPDLSLPSS